MKINFTLDIDRIKNESIKDYVFRLNRIMGLCDTDRVFIDMLNITEVISKHKIKEVKIGKVSTQDEIGLLTDWCLIESVDQKEIEKILIEIAELVTEDFY